MKHNGAGQDDIHTWNEWIYTGAISFLGLMLFIFDMSMLVFFIKALKCIIKHYSKDYEINLTFVTIINVLICITYIIEMAWSDLCMWGSLLNFLDFFQGLRTLNSEQGPEYYTYCVMVVNAIICTFFQGFSILIVFQHFGSMKRKQIKISMQKYKDSILNSSSKQSDLKDPYNPNSLLSLLDSKEKKRISKSNQEIESVKD